MGKQTREISQSRNRALCFQRRACINDTSNLSARSWPIGFGSGVSLPNPLGDNRSLFKPVQLLLQRLAARPASERRALIPYVFSRERRRRRAADESSINSVPKKTSWLGMRSCWGTESSFATSRHSQTHLLVQGRLGEGKQIMTPLYAHVSPVGRPCPCFSAPGSPVRF